MVKSGWRRVFVACVGLALAACKGEDSPGTVATVREPVTATPLPVATSTPLPSAAPAVTRAVETIDVLLVMGQSNATGYQRDYRTDYVRDPDVLAWNGTELVTYAPIRMTGLDWGQPGGSWAAELGYAQRFRAQYPSRKLLIVRFTAPSSFLGATNLPLADWNPSSSGELLDQAHAALDGALAAARARGLAPQLRLVWWQQGEADVDDIWSTMYLDNLTRLVTTLRHPDWGFGVPADTPIAIGRLSAQMLTRGVGALAVRTAQEWVAQADIGGPQVLIDTDDLPMEADGVHFAKAGQLLLGERLWAIDQGSYAEP